MGMMLCHAWNHVEALQTTDIPLLVHYITGVLEETVKDPQRVREMSLRGDINNRQEVMCLHYFHSLISHVDCMGEERVMPFVRAAGTTTALAKMLHTNHSWIGDSALMLGAEVLAMVCATEDFATYRASAIYFVSMQPTC
ncbi:unnamed protein product [Choristocarpus tenellus]